MIPIATHHLLAAADAASSTEVGDILQSGLRFTHAVAVYVGAALSAYLVLLLGGRLLKRRLQIPLSWVYNLFCLLAALYLPTLLPFVAIPGTDHIRAALVVVGAFVVVGLVRHYFFDLFLQRGAGAQVPKFLSEFVSIAIIIAALLTVIKVIYHTDVPGVLAGAGILGIVLGLALQDTLGNIFSGFAIYFGGQFKAGDWLQVDDRHAQIVEINWRSTRLRTTDDICLDIPNSNITKQTIINFNYPTSIHGIRLDIGLEYDAPPHVVKKVLIQAALDCPLVLRNPAPDVYLTAFADWSVNYQLRFWLADHVHLNPANSQIRMNLWYALRRNKIKIPYPIQQEMWLDKPEPHTEDRNRIRASISNAVFAPALSSEQLDGLVENAKIVLFGEGETIVRQDAPAGPMYVLINGHAGVSLNAQGSIRSVANLGPGSCIGEMSILTGEARIATVTALEDILAVEVEKNTIVNLVASNPELLDALGELLAQRRMQNEGIVAEHLNSSNAATKSHYKAGFMSRLRTFLEV